MVRGRKKAKYARLGKIAAAVVVMAAVITAAVIIVPSPKKPAHTEWGEVKTVDVYVETEKRTVTMELEDYIVHVVAGEMPAAYESEALSAQAVAARTYTVHKGGCARTGADICTSSACCQTYASEEVMRERWGGDYDMYFAKVTDAVSKTEGLILTYDGEPIEALYHASSGGMTESAENVYGNNRPYLVSVSSPEAESLSKYSLPRAEAAEIISQKYPDAGITAKNIDKELEIISRYESGRAKLVRIGNEEIAGRELRALFALRSTEISIRFTDADVVFETLGYGHGVGMSQDGAQTMAKDGADFKDILLHYYPDTTLEMY